jgi:hypothetical protein
MAKWFDLLENRTKSIEKTGRNCAVLSLEAIALV